jgi:DNA repair protein SbcC/Rad50
MLKNLLRQHKPAPVEAKPAPPGTDISPDELRGWRERIGAARADDAALLELAHGAPTAELKLAAIEALTHEESLRRAMREFGERDKRLYRAAKSGLQAIGEKRKAAERASALIACVRGLLEQEFIPVNRAVELDQAWNALDKGLLEPGLAEEFAALSAQLGERARARGEGEQATLRWLAAVYEAIGRLKASLAGVAQGTLSPDAARSPAAELQELLTNVQDASDPRCAQSLDAANRALALAASIVQRAAFLQALPAPESADEAGDKARIEQWLAIPEVPEAELQAILAHRFAEWRNAGLEARARAHDERRTEEQKRRAEEERRRLGAIEEEVKAAEAALAAGQVAELARLMAAIERALKSGPASAALARRIDSLRRGQLRLRDWQRWSGRQGREQLVAEAQALERAGAGKIAIKTHAEAIDKLRERWKELDKLGAPSSQHQWQAFDGALKAAHAPVAAHLEKLKAARNENLAARNRVIEELQQAAASHVPAAEWRAVARALDDAQAAWRRLGPVEHTVPRQAQQGEKGIAARYAAARQALEAPLASAYREAAGQREGFIADAKRLAGSSGRDLVDKVRALQGKWQAHAKALPLPRDEENRLWSAFRSATDALFAERDAARAAKEAEANARREAREAATRRAASIAQGRFDALLAAMALCDEVEADAPADLEARWNAIEHFPDSWRKRLEARLRGSDPGSANLRDSLLRLEMACGLESPPELHADRQRLKLLALKEAMENRRGGASTPQDIERWLLDAAATPRPDVSSRERLSRIIAALRRSAFP